MNIYPNKTVVYTTEVSMLLPGNVDMSEEEILEFKEIETKFFNLQKKIRDLYFDAIGVEGGC